MRLYTNGDFVDSSILRALSKAGLNEIRFSIKMEDFYEGKLSLIRLFLPTSTNL